MILRYQINKTALKQKKAKKPKVQAPEAPTPTPETTTDNQPQQPKQVVVEEEEEKPTDAQKELLDWVKKQIKDYPVTVNDFTNRFEKKIYF